MLRAGIVGLPNVGKSTLFNAVTRTRGAQAANYPFCTIDPNVGIVTVPDARLAVLQKIAKTSVVIPAAIEFVDIAGLVKGASTGEGLGNKFLTHIREVDAIVQVVRCFEDDDVLHVSGTVDPVRDIEVINTELMLADLESVTKKRERVAKDAKRGDKAAIAEDAVLAKLIAALEAGRPALTADLSPEERAVARQFFLLSDKPTIFACNVKDTDLATADRNPYVVKVRDYVKTHLSCEAVVISAQIESELIDLSPEEGEEFLTGDFGRAESGMGSLIRSTYHLLGLQTYFTAGEKEVRAWTIHVGQTRRRRPPASSTPTSSAASSRPRRSPTTTWWPAARPRPRARRASTGWKARRASRQGRRRRSSSSTSSRREGLRQHRRVAVAGRRLDAEHPA
ncbi:MAG: redox-regulated ATPase YchF [Vicinamibacterales bacterium]